MNRFWSLFVVLAALSFPLFAGGAESQPPISPRSNDIPGGTSFPAEGKKKIKPSPSPSPSIPASSGSH